MNTFQAPASKFLILDIEVLNDNKLYAEYQQLDPRAADLRWPFRRICAASVLTCSISEGIFEFGTFKSFACNDERKVLTELFNLLHEFPDHVAVSWGGQAFDLPVLRIAAAEHQLRLPPQLVNGARRGREWLHRDLALELKGGAGPYVHLSEIATRLRLPVKFGGSAAMVPMLLAHWRWNRLMEIPEADVITLACALASQLCAHGQLISADAAHFIILDEVWKRRPTARYKDYIARVRNRIRREMMEKARAFVDAA